MKIICISTLDKFSRFYLDINQELKSKTNSSLKIISIHFSGFLYTLLRLKYSCFISFSVWIKVNFKKKYYQSIIKDGNTYQGINYNEFIQFHLGLNKNISKTDLQYQSLAYIDFFNNFFESQKPDFLISISDSRMCVEIAVALARQKGVKVFYIEQGPFNTTFFDDQGVNANLSIRKNSSVENTIPSKSNDNSKPVKYSRSPFYRGFDILFMKLFEKSKLYPPDLKHTDINTYKKKISRHKSLIDIYKLDYVLFALQIPLDVNMIYHSPIYNSHLEIIKDLSENLPTSLKLVVREHPLYIGKYDEEVYSYIEDHNIIIDNFSSLDDALENATIVVVNNSTVGIEAIFKYKPVVVLGNAFYDNDKVCTKINYKEEVGELLQIALTKTPNKLEIDRFKNSLYNSVMLKGGITDKNLVSSKTIANHLISNS
ncbi:hypothetical protein [Winogradskyella sp. A2]|uniref:capsular polysaccharide export protein, LipB/KpsS family n=1 Tax=Winogradskyella sp. A2 TaxID=3366944 RepID=UPI00398C3BD0